MCNFERCCRNDDIILPGMGTRLYEVEVNSDHTRSRTAGAEIGHVRYRKTFRLFAFSGRQLLFLRAQFFSSQTSLLIVCDPSSLYDIYVSFIQDSLASAALGIVWKTLGQKHR